MNTTMREAFLKMPFTPAALSSKVGKLIVKASLRGAGIKRSDSKGWSAKLSYRTAQKLKADGIIQ